MVNTEFLRPKTPDDSMGGIGNDPDQTPTPPPDVEATAVPAAAPTEGENPTPVESENVYPTNDLDVALQLFDKNTKDARKILRELEFAATQTPLTPEELNELIAKSNRIRVYTGAAGRFLLDKIGELEDENADPALIATVEGKLKIVKEVSETLKQSIKELEFPEAAKDTAAKPEPARSEAAKPASDELHAAEADALVAMADGLIDKAKQLSDTQNKDIAQLVADEKELKQGLAQLKDAEEDFDVIMEILRDSKDLEQRKAEKKYRTQVLDKVTAARKKLEEAVTVVTRKQAELGMDDAKKADPKLTGVAGRVEAYLNVPFVYENADKKVLNQRQGEIETLIAELKAARDESAKNNTLGDALKNHVATLGDQLQAEFNKIKAEQDRKWAVFEKTQEFEIQRSVYHFLAGKVPFLDDEMAGKFGGQTLRDFLLSNNGPGQPGEGLTVDTVDQRVEAIKANPKEYFSIVAPAIYEIMIKELWNKRYANSSDPHTADYQTEPLKGPAQNIKLMDTLQSYDRSDKNRVTNLTTLFDQFEVIFDKDTPARLEGAAFAERMKGLGKEISVWHNRAYLFRENLDPTGPAGSLKALKTINDNPGKYGSNLAHFFDQNGPVPANATPEQKAAAEMSKAEKKLAEAIEFSMGVWGYLSLTPPNKKKLVDAGLVSQDILDLVNKPDPLDPKKKLYADIASTGNTRQDIKVKFIEDMIATAQAKFGIPEKTAQLAYHIGESFRIGSGVEIALDVKYEPSKGDTTKPIVDKAGAVKLDEHGRPILEPSHVVKVPAQGNGASKGMYAGMYAEYADANPDRPDYLKTFGEYLAKTYPTYADVWQANHSYHHRVTGLPADISGFGDNRASLAEILAVQGAIRTVDWRPESLSSTPDAIVFSMANQAIGSIWPRVSISSAKKPEFAFFVTAKDLVTTPTRLIDSYEEISNARSRHSYPRQDSKFFGKLSQRVGITPDDDILEAFCFDTSTGGLSQEKKDKIGTVVKDIRDYWVSPVLADVNTHPLDSVRILNSMFTRGGRPKENRGYVHPKIRNMIEAAKQKVQELQTATPITWTDPKDSAIRDLSKWINSTMIPLVNGYITYDVLMKANLELFTPDFDMLEAEVKYLAAHHDTSHAADADGKSKFRLNQSVIRQMYEHLDYSNYEGHPLLTISGDEIMHSSRVHALINMTLAFRDMHLAEAQNPTEKIRQAGYTLEEYPSDFSVRDKIFDRHEILKLLQTKYHLGEGYKYDRGPNLKGGLEYKLIPANWDYVPGRLGRELVLRKNPNVEKTITIQVLMDRIKLFGKLFGENKSH